MSERQRQLIESYTKGVKTINPNDLELPKEGKIGRKKKILKRDREDGSFAVVSMDRVRQIQHRGIHLFTTLCVLSIMEKTTAKQSSKRGTFPWFYVSPDIWKGYGILKQDWYRTVNMLVKDGVLQKKRKAAKNGKSLYAFTDRLPESDLE